MGGCLPMLVQFPFLIALYQFFPASIELRQKAFLWADDLSSYDSILDLPFDIPFYGDHVSLFTLLMAISIVISTKISGAQMQGSTQMPGMKMMLYMMPVMMLFWFNKYSSGLSYYYFLSNVITVGQTLVIRRFVDDEAVLRKLNENKKKPKTKSRFQEKLEKMAQQRGYNTAKRK
jgi:YidC/Oxa1 family membrane protein insertase